MFTGLIIERGSLIEDPAPSGQGGVRLTIGLSPDLTGRLVIGDSLAVSGVCLTVIEKEMGRVAVELSPETLSRTTLAGLNRGDAVNLEPALRMGDALGGHWVQGHVDGTARVVDRRDLTDHRVLAFSIPPDLAPFLVEKGSVTVDGVSLTVSGLASDRFEVALIPHTLEVTTLSKLVPGDYVNLEMDVLGKYVHRILAARGLATPLPETGGGWP
ncbi:MAG TPA: riboflavin synthase [Thermoanaerobaculia bacterium]|jgi:riboflavin synthase|nr:riboflavin synthase [Thermoanaerobaculia bacterium]